MCMLIHVQLFVTPRSAAHQAPLSMELSRQEYWDGLPFPHFLLLGWVFPLQGLDPISCLSCIGKWILLLLEPCIDM